MFILITVLAIIAAVACIVWSIYEGDIVSGILELVFIFVLYGLLWILIFGVTNLIITPEYESGEVVNSTGLINLRDELGITGSRGLFYVSVSSDNKYVYYVEIEAPEEYGEGKAYESRELYNDNVVIIENNEYIDNAKLVKYVHKVKTNFWTWGYLTDKIAYVFYVPEGTVARNISLGE